MVDLWPIHVVGSCKTRRKLQQSYLSSTITKFFSLLLFMAKAISKTSIVFCYNIFLTMLMQECFGCSILCNRIMVEKDFFDKIDVFYTRWNVQWVFAYVLLLINNGKLSLTGALKTYGGDLKIGLSYIFLNLVHATIQKLHHPISSTSFQYEIIACHQS